jgi:antirestriction protein ArdC
MAEIGSELQIENAVAYIQSWMKALNNDKTLIVSASAKSEKAVNYILNKAEREEV